MSETAWDAYLGELEAAVAESSRLLRDGSLEALRPVQDGAPPPGLGPLPPSRAARATLLLRELDALTAELGRAQSATSRELSEQRRLRPSSGPVSASYVDSYG